MRLRTTVMLAGWTVLATLTAIAQQAAAQPTEQSCRRFVQNFYDWYVPRILKSATTYDTALKSKAALFSPLLVRALREDLAASKANSGEIVGLDFDPFLNSQDPSTKFSVTKAQVQGMKCSAEVRGIADGISNEEVHPELAFRNGTWQFVNFRYEQSSDLLSMLKSLKADRQKATARVRAE